MDQKGDVGAKSINPATASETVSNSVSAAPPQVSRTDGGTTPNYSDDASHSEPSVHHRATPPSGADASYTEDTYSEDVQPHGALRREPTPPGIAASSSGGAVAHGEGAVDSEIAGDDDGYGDDFEELSPNPPGRS